MGTRGGVGVADLAWIIVIVLATIIHVWGVLIAFAVEGMVAAFLTFMLPVLSAVYWFFRVGIVVGFDSMYCISFFVLAGVALVAAIAGAAAGNNGE
jgi:hypothetical protein